MYLKQLSVFLENSKGKLRDVTKIIADNNLNIFAFGIADTENFGIIRMIVENPDAAKKALEDNGITSKLTDVIGVRLTHTPGEFYKILDLLYNYDISVEYSYAYITNDLGDDAVIIIKTGDDKKTIDVMQNAGIKLY